jgi:hypothetical protein
MKGNGMKPIRVCAWCEKPLNLRSRLFLLVGNPLRVQISHGICKGCRYEEAKKYKEKFNKELG